MPSGDKKKHKNPSRKKSELDSALDQVGDESAAAAIQEFQDLLGEAKGDTQELVRENAEELERRLVLLKNRQIDKEDFDYFVENQKRALRVYVDAQPAQRQEHAEKVTLKVLEIAATKVVPILIAMI
jgi:hypothetical protein